MEKATFAAGCFWGVEAAFRKIPGVISTCVGYTGGFFPNPCYLDVCARITGHAEAVQIEYDPSIVTYEELLEVFWNIHDPTQLNRQGPDRGEQYRSAIFYHTPNQENAARLSKRKLQLSGKYKPNKNVGAKHIALRAWLRLPGDNLSDKTIDCISECFAQDNKDIVTEIKPISEFYLAEEEHQQYLEKKAKEKQAKSATEPTG